MKNILAASTSTLYGQKYLEYLKEELVKLFQHTDEVLFIPFARPSGISHDMYTKKASQFFLSIDKQLVGIHQSADPLEAIQKAKGIFTGGGNTFVLVDQLHRQNLMQPLREAILNGTPYLGTSAGSNLCGPSMQTTNDMPIVYPPSFKTLGVIPFNINAHYLDSSTNGEHMGETRATRIAEFHTQQTVPVIGLREGSWLRVQGSTMTLQGSLHARMFEQNKVAIEIDSSSEWKDI